MSDTDSTMITSTTERDILRRLRGIEHELQLQSQTSNSMLSAVLQKQVETFDRLFERYYSELLKIAPAMLIFCAARECLHDFNKRNAVADNPLSWGDNGKYTRIESVNSLKTWLFTEAAAELKISPTYMEDFMVVNDGGNLVTFDEEFKDGYHPSAFWIPARKYSREPSKDWSHPCMKERDPRKKYIDPKTGKAWCTSCIETRKRGLSESG